MGKLLKAVEKSIKHGIANGRIDANRDAATIEMLKHMANVLDADETEASSVMRYVSPASFLSYCEKLGFLPDDEPVVKEQARILQMVGNSKWKKQA